MGVFWQCLCSRLLLRFPLRFRSTFAICGLHFFSLYMKLVFVVEYVGYLSYLHCCRWLTFF